MKNMKAAKKPTASKLAKFDTLQLSTTAQKKVKGGNDIIIVDDVFVS